MTVIETFAGPGGWGEGGRALGIEPIGVEINGDAIRTASHAGHRRIEADVSLLDPHDLAAVVGVPGEHGPEVEGEIGSPPCPSFSISNRHATGRRDAAEILGTLEHVHDLPRLEHALRLLRPRMSDERTLLALEPLRWALALMPRWVALEQVPPVLPLWEACARILRGHGYSVATGHVHAEQYGVPQTRRRAVLLAHRDREVALPAPTHSRYHPRDPQRLDEGVLPWVSMAEALGWGMTHRPYPTVAVGTGGGGGTDPAALGGSGARRLVHAERDAGVLQGFRADYPWHGERGSRFQQIGNAVPPPLAAALLGAVAGR